MGGPEKRYPVSALKAGGAGNVTTRLDAVDDCA